MTWQEFGLSGYLAPNGRYYECEYEQHQKLAQKLVKRYKLNVQQVDANRVGGFVKIGCAPWLDDKAGNSMCHVFMFEAPTAKQITWIKANIHRMTERQQRDTLRALYVYDIEIEGGIAL